MALGDAETTDFWTSLSCGPCESAGSRSPPRRIPPGSCWSPVTRTPASGPRSGRSFPGRPGSAAAPRFARSITSRLGSARPRARGRARLDHLRPDQQGGGHGPVQARRRLPEGPVPRDRPDADRRRAGPNGLRHDPSAPGSTGPRSGRSNPIERLNREIKRRADVAPGLPRQRLRTPPDRLRPARATRSGSTANDATCPRPPCDT